MDLSELEIAYKRENKDLHKLIIQCDEINEVMYAEEYIHGIQNSPFKERYKNALQKNVDKEYAAPSSRTIIQHLLLPNDLDVEPTFINPLTFACVMDPFTISESETTGGDMCIAQVTATVYMLIAEGEFLPNKQRFRRNRKMNGSFGTPGGTGGMGRASSSNGRGRAPKSPRQQEEDDFMNAEEEDRKPAAKSGFWRN